jgi:sterol desaturase/sphingolipid hydroxylase (fatty acid hydroxylase superfamily)
MNEVVGQEAVWRLGPFFGILLLMAVWELLAARRDLGQPRLARWTANLGIAALNALVVRLLFPAAGVGMALLAEDREWGVLNSLEVSPAVAVPLSILLLDLAIYLQHVLFHAVPALWRLHRVHHADEDVDFTTGIRFHPLEIVLSLAIKFAVIAALGPSPLAVFLFAVILNGTSMFNHGNVRIPTGLDQALRWVVVTPDMHRVHHSIRVPESNSNFGFNLPWWDRLLGTYRAQPAGGHRGMVLGVDGLRQPAARSLLSLLTLPFVGTPGRQPISSDRDGDEG